MRKLMVLFLISSVCLASRSVYITPTGKKYHSTKSCRSLSRSKKIMTVSIDKVGNRQPCKICF